MIRLLFSADGRINRALFWWAVVLQVLAACALAVALVLLWQVIPGEIKPDGSYNVTGARALPYLLLIFGFIGLSVWSGICIGIKRFHDRAKSGLWVLIQFVPFIGAIWYFVEVACLKGTPGPNSFGPDPLSQTGSIVR